MSSRISSSMSVIIISGFFAAASFAQIITLPPDSVYAYPQYRLSPKNPTMNDSVSFRIVNLHDNVCVPEQYQKAFSTVQTSSNVCVRSPCPQDYTIRLSYEPYVPHCAVIDTVPSLVKTEYGPLFSLGKLAVGDYTLVDSMDNNRMLMKFTVYENKPVFSISGTVIEDAGDAKVLIPVKNGKVYLKRPVYGGIALQIYPPVMLDTIIDSTTTSSQGMFSFSGVGPDSYVLGFAASGYQSRDVGVACSSDTNVSVTLLPLNGICTISGTVYEATPPGVIGCGYSPVGCVVGTVEACTVSVSIPMVLYEAAAGSGLKASPYLLTGRQAITDKNGNYRIDSVPVTYANRAVTVLAGKSGFAPESRSVTLQPNVPVLAYFALQRLFANRKESVINNLTFTVETDKGRYNPGEAINVRYTVKNNSTATVSYSIGGCAYDMIARGPAGDTVYWYLKNKACPAVILTVNLAPGDSEVMAFPAFTYSGSSSMLAITAQLNAGGSFANLTALSINVYINQPTSVRPVALEKIGLAVASRVISWSRASKTISLNIPSPQTVSVSAFMINGRKTLARKRFLPAGISRIRLDNAALGRGAIIFRVEGANFSETATINLQ